MQFIVSGLAAVDAEVTTSRSIFGAPLLSLLLVYLLGHAVDVSIGLTLSLKPPVYPRCRYPLTFTSLKTWLLQILKPKSSSLRHGR